MSYLVEAGTLTQEAADMLGKLVRSHYSFLISGGTSAGKTTFLNALSAYVPKQERLITIEDNAELQIPHMPNLVRLEAKTANMEGNEPITIRDLVKTALRMRPDRIIVGEVRGEEAFDLLQALNTGHDGSLSTIHANAAADTLFRLETLVLMSLHVPLLTVRRQIVSGIDGLIHLSRLPDGTRRVTEITELAGFEGEDYELNPLFKWDDKSRALLQVGELKNKEKISRGCYGRI